MFAPETTDLGRVRLLANINFHFSSEKLPHLAEVIRALAEMDIARLDLCICTNSEAAPDHEILARICRYFLAPGTFSILAFTGLEDPRFLVWCHKEAVLRARFLDGGEGHTHFLCLEDDIRFTSHNLRYFLGAREFLRPYNLLPGFYRVEYDTARHVYVSVDHFNTTFIAEYRRIAHEGMYFITSAYPYCAMFLLDRDMAEEHANSPGFAREDSKNLIWWDILERANLGLAYDRVPEGFHNRHAIPVHQDSLDAASCCWVTHLGNKYARSGTVLGQLSMRDTFWWSREGKFPVG